MKRVHLFITGRVQGVSFRYSTRKKARKYGLKGFVRNENGDVEVVAEGDNASIKKLMDFCRKGPMLARVDDVKVIEEDPTGEFDSFDVKY